jgi:hypothetical protein
MDQSTLLWAEPLASPSQLQDSEREWLTLVATWPSSFCDLLIRYAPGGLYGKTSPVFCQAGKDGTLAPSLEGWQNAGMVSPTESWTLSISEFPSGAAACSLSDILEIGDLPQRYFLSAKACKGILRRAEKRGKELPEPLMLALKAAASLEVMARPTGT